MERLLQYLDDLDDLYGMVGLIRERLWRVIRAALAYLAISVVAVSAIVLALIHQPLAMAISTLLFVTLMYRSVTVPSTHWPHTA